MVGMSAAKLRHPRPRRAGKHSTLGEKSADSIHTFLAGIFGGRRITTILALVGSIVILAGSAFWFYKVYSNPENVFWGMVGNNLSTPSISKEIVQKSEGSSSKENTLIAFRPAPSVHDIKEISTTVNGTKSRIKVESIGTPKDTYQRYVLIEQPVQPGKSKPDYSNIYKMWLKNGGNAQANNSQLFNNALFSGFLFGNLQPNNRDTAVSYMRKAYKVNFDDINNKSDNSRKTYTYKVKLSLKEYAKGAHYYAELLRLPNAKQISADNYKATDKLEMAVTVDVLSRQLRQVTYTSNSSSEKYTAYGIVPNFESPKKTVSYNDLQEAVKKAVSK
jgi:hypothetical protein